ncbi:glutamate synthase subunit beta [bacterium]|nr:glutamate synthase subunit beta [bacterium]
MAKPTGFLEIERQDPPKKPVEERIQNFQEFETLLSEKDLQQQASRCMDCGVPFCHAYGCPAHNRVPDWNNMIYRGQWQRALEFLHATTNFPEFTGRVCPALCEAACTLGINQKAVSIRQIERHLVERGWREGWIQPEPALEKSGKRVAVVGSGPAGLAAAQQLARLGHEVVVFEKNNRVGGLLRYGIPDFKLEKWVIDRRLKQMQAEGVIFETGVEAGVDLSVRYMQRMFDAIVITAGATISRNLAVPGRDLHNIHFAMDYLKQQNQRVASEALEGPEIHARGKHVVVIGGGDTGSDCVGTARRQGALWITQLELLPKPPEQRDAHNPWPTWPTILRTSSSHEEGCDRVWSLMTQEFMGEGRVESLKAVKLNWSKADANGRRSFEPIPGSQMEIKADLVLLALGFLHVNHGPLVQDCDLQLDDRGNIAVDANNMTSVPGVFAAGDSASGASLVIRAITEGREAASGVHQYLSS